MNYKHLNIKKIISRVSFTLSIVLGLIVLTSNLQRAMAQKPTHFTTNGKDVKIRKFNKKVSKMMSEIGIPGMSLAIIEDGEVVFFEGYGKRRQGKPEDTWDVANTDYGYSVKNLKETEKVSKETVFSGASLSKTYLSFVAFHMADEGTLDLDKPLYEYLEHNGLKYDKRYKLITARMILSHSSGLENWWSQNLSSVLEIIHTPGEVYEYSGEGYNYLSLVIEEILQQPYEVYVKERVLEPLGLQNTYLKFNDGGKDTPLSENVPSNFAAGHRLSGGQYLLRNTGVNPAFANHFTAEDYAKLVLGMFDTKHLSSERQQDILEPQVRIGKSEVSYGPAFEVSFQERDTIISHGGDNLGYKNWMFYSTVQKRGFVMMTNNDWGKALASRINEMSVRLDLDKFISPYNNFTAAMQYPNPSLTLFKTLEAEDTTAMYSAFEELKQKGKMDIMSLTGLILYFKFYGDYDIGTRLLEEAKVLFPDSALTHCLQGEYYLDRDEYKLALHHLNMSKSLNFNYWDIDRNIAKCEKRLSYLNE